MLSALSFLERGTFMQIANSHNGFVYNAGLLAPPPPYSWVTGTRIALKITCAFGYEEDILIMIPPSHHFCVKA